MKKQVVIKQQRHLDELYVKAVNERKAIENDDRQLIVDLMNANKALRDLTVKFKICNKHDKLLQQVDELKTQIDEKDKELNRMSKLQIDLNQQVKTWKAKVEASDNEVSYMTSQYQETSR